MFWWYIYTPAVWGTAYLFLGKRMKRLWMPGLIGVGIQMFTDYLGTAYKLYSFPHGLFYWDRLPLMHIFDVLPVSMLFVNWLPGRWPRRALYILFSSAVFLAVEALARHAGAIAYLRWKLWYSYLVLVAGLVIFSFLLDLLTKKNGLRQTGSPRPT